MDCSRTQGWVAVAAAMVFFGGVASAEEGGWETIQTRPILIKARAVKGTSVKEIWAEGVMNAPVEDIQATILDPDRFSDFMPYVKESRVVGDPAPDGTRWVYTRLDFSTFVSSRDYVVRDEVLERVKEDGSGAFRNRWKADPTKLPVREDVVRVTVNEGSWKVTARGPDKSYAIYRFMVDPGGWIPPFAANLGNKEGVTDTFKAVEKEAKRRRSERLGRASAAAGR